MAARRAAPARGGGRKRKKGGFRAVLAAAVVTVIIGLVVIALVARERRERPSEGRAVSQGQAPHEGRAGASAPAAAPKAAEAEGRMEALVYSASTDGEHLTARRVNVRKGPPADGIRDAVNALLSEKPGPAGPTVPRGTRLLAVKVEDAVAYVDLSGELIDGFAGGASDEILTVYAIVNTVALNFKEVKRVQILVEGKKEATLAGHIDISRPLFPSKGVIKGGAHG